MDIKYIINEVSDLNRGFRISILKEGNLEFVFKSGEHPFLVKFLLENGKEDPQLILGKNTSIETNEVEPYLDLCKEFFLKLYKIINEVTSSYGSAEGLSIYFNTLIELKIFSFSGEVSRHNRNCDARDAISVRLKKIGIEIPKNPNH
ncbi:MAG: hypothetical protein N4A44_05200 [Alphaproteobacteria bacterium]|jgi:hypothetical protein|nr:hypothetical protein [Alphaproteobacteria bacterium]